MVPSAVTFGAITQRVGRLPSLHKETEIWGNGAQGRPSRISSPAPSTHLPAAHPPPLAESQKVFREPLGDHLSNSVAGSLPLPPRGPIQTSLPMP